MPRITAAWPNLSRTRSIARSAGRRGARSRSVIVGLGVPAVSALTPTPSRRKRVPSISRASRSRAGAKILPASCVGRLSERAGALPEVGGFQLQRDGRAGKFAVLQPRRDLLAQPPEHFLQRPKRAMSVSKVVSPRRSWRSRSGTTSRSSMPRASRDSRWPSAPSGASGRSRRRAADRRSGGSRLATAVPAVALPTP